MEKLALRRGNKICIFYKETLCIHKSISVAKKKNHEFFNSELLLSTWTETTTLQVVVWSHEMAKRKCIIDAQKINSILLIKISVKITAYHIMVPGFYLKPTSDFRFLGHMLGRIIQWLRWFVPAIPVGYLAWLPRPGFYIAYPKLLQVFV